MSLLLATCMFVVGGGTGGTDKPMGKTTTKEKCADLVRSNETSANGATWGGGECYAEFGAISNNDNDQWKTCLFQGQLL